MKSASLISSTVILSCIISLGASATTVSSTEKEPRIPRFSVDNIDKTVDPAKDFYRYANGNWIKNNPVPADKARWGSFGELDERNNFLIHSILEKAAADKSAPAKSPTAEVGNFFAAAMDTARIEQLKFKPLEPFLTRIDQLKTTDDLFKLLANFHKEGINGVFDSDVQPDAKDSSTYAFQLTQGGLSLPDRDYYLKEDFKKQREEYVSHVKKMLVLMGETEADADKHAATVMDVETELAKASRSRVDLRDPIKNYNKVKVSELVSSDKDIPWKLYLTDRDVPEITFAIVGQPEYFTAVDKMVKARPLSDWKTYLRWHVLHSAAPYLHDAVEVENFNFFGKVLSGKQIQEPRWKRAEKVIDGSIGEALGELYVAKYFPPEARAKMIEMVDNLRAVFHDHLQKLEWMGEATRAKALAKFDRFTQKIGYPEKFRDYSSIDITRTDYLGDVLRSESFEIHRRTVRVGKKVDKTEWEMSPPTVNAYFNPLQNEIVFPAGILQPPFFDLTMDDPINYGAIAAVIGHEISHGYDDEGRHYDADGNLVEWWTDKDSKEFDARAQKVVDEYNGFEALPGLHVNGKLTLGENIADLGGVSLAYDAMERALKKDPSKRKDVDGFTPEQRFFLSFSQLWHTNIRDAEQKRLITVDPHSPGQFRAVGPLMNYQEFYDAFGIKEGSPMWRAPELRAKIW